MKTLETEIVIDASPQTVWSIMDDLERYPEWNALVPELQGRTTVGEVVRGKLVQPPVPVIPLAPTITRIVGARELRWITHKPGEDGFTAEHYFLLEPTENGGTHLIHNENFDGPGVPAMWERVDTTGRKAYNQMNADLKARAEGMKNAAVRLHPAVDSQTAQTPTATRSVHLQCYCEQDKVEVMLTEPVAHNHLCGCSKCWKPDGALFAQTAVVPADAVTVTAHGNKLEVIDRGQSIQRSACRQCGVHMHGDVPDRDDHFHGLVFVHPELAVETDVAPWPEFAGFVSSIIETGTSPSIMESVRAALGEAGIPAYDAFSPELMDIIAWHKRKIARSQVAK